MEASPLGIEGPLSELNLMEVYQLIHMSRRTGVLQVQSEGRKAWVSFINGSISAAELEGDGARDFTQQLVGAGVIEESQAQEAKEKKGSIGPGIGMGQTLRKIGVSASRELFGAEIKHIEEVSFEIFGWTEGAFLFEEIGLEEDPEGPSGTHMLTENIIMEGSRRIDEWSLIRKYVPSLDGVPKLKAAGSEGEDHIELQPDEWLILALMDGRRTVKEIATEAGWDDFQTSKLLYGLSVTGILTVEEDGGAGGMRSASSSLLVAADLYRKGEYTSALELLKSIVEKERELREAWVLLGNCCYRLSKYRAAADAYARALSLDNRDKMVMLNFGLCLIRLGRLEDAQSRWREAISWEGESVEDDQLKEYLKRLDEWIQLIQVHEP